MVFQHGKLNIPQKCKNYSENEQLAASVNNLAAVYANLIAQMYAVANAPVPKFSNGAADQYANTGAGGQSASGGDPNSDDPGDNERYTDSAHWNSDRHYHWRVRTYKSGRTEKQIKVAINGIFAILL